MSSSYHDQLAVLDFSDELGLFAVPLLDMDQLVSFHGHDGLKDRKVSNESDAASCWSVYRQFLPSNHKLKQRNSKSGQYCIWKRTLFNLKSTHVEMSDDSGTNVILN